MGGQSLVILGNKVKMEVDVATNMGIKISIQDLLILENGESLAMDVQCEDSVRVVNIDTFGTKLSNPLESAEHKAVEDNLLDDSTIEVCPEIDGVEPHNQCFFDPDSPDQKSRSHNWTGMKEDLKTYTSAFIICQKLSLIHI